ncbi:MAG: selenocysteine-specific translation elongation factor [Planctomycetes bacterium]|nr:selenocysteine-specific translation elongation factor [Planctomycetota bacterium]
MEIQPIVIGTAGHIDHGKSTLVRALTGIDPDRLKEEKARGLTIDLGFAPLELPDGRLVGIVDVPGHERFIKNMVAGASGIDLVVLVVAADDGVMPQTREHLSIMGLLGVARGLVALTKVDMVDPELVDLAEEDVRESLRGTFLEGAPILRVSAVTGAGMDAFRAALFAAAAEVEPRSADGVFRMPIQRVFSPKGFGTVLTGIPVSGRVAVGDTVEVLPGGFRGKVRGLQAYKQPTQVARAGHSTAINLSDVSHKDVTRGCVAAQPGFFRAVRMVGARLTALADLERPIENRTPVRLHTGTAEVLGEVVLLDSEELAPGETALVQLRLEEPVVCAPGDPFILRLASPLVTLGGGRILEESRHRLKRFKGFVIDELGRQEQSLASPRELLEVVLLRSGEALRSVEELEVEIKRSREVTRELLAELEQRGAAVSADKGQRWLHAEGLEAALEHLRATIAAWFAEHPLREVVDTRDLRVGTGYEPSFLNFLLEEEARRGGLSVEPGGKVRLAGREVGLDEGTRALAAGARERLEAAAFQPPSVDELAAELGVREAQLRSVLALLVDQEELVPLSAELYLGAGAAERGREAVRRNCEAHGHLEIPALRDALGTSRKYLIPLLERYDAEGLTLRQGGHRILRKR